MKKLLQLSLILFSLILFSCDKNNDNNDDDEINMKAGYSYYRATNYTDAKVNFQIKVNGYMFIEIDLKPKEIYVFDVAVIGSGTEIVCFIDNNYYLVNELDNSNGVFNHNSYYAISDRTLTEIGIRKKE